MKRIEGREKKHPATREKELNLVQKPKRTNLKKCGQQPAGGGGGKTKLGKKDK